ncbi:MAG: ATP-binding protein, partial [Phycisphaerales bacterium]|nr:ATP-binding protein [Phycisphaerales bacterium]
VPAVPFRELTTRRRGTDSATVRARVVAARSAQRRRQGDTTNAELSGADLDRFAAMPDEARVLLGQALTELGLSARAYDKIRRVARTIADLEAAERVASHHVAEAVQYRQLDRA